MLSFGSAGINRHRERNGRVRHRRSSAPRWPRPCVGVREDDGEALDRGTCRQGYGAAKSAFRGADAVRMSGRQHRRRRQTRAVGGPRAVREPLHAGSLDPREPGDPTLAVPLIGGGPPREGRGRTPGMYERGKSDRLVVPTKPPNKAIAAEVVEGRGRGEGNPVGTTRPGHRAGSGVPNVPDRVRRMGAGGRAAVITSLLGAGPCDVRPKPGAQCGSPARWDLAGGRPARAVPPATRPVLGSLRRWKVTPEADDPHPERRTPLHDGAVNSRLGSRLVTGSHSYRHRIGRTSETA